jgi:prevent-host-death family protein
LLVNLAKIEGVQVNVHQAKSQLSRLLQLVEEGERVIITRHGQPVAELAPARRKGFPFGAARKEPLVPAGDDWWQPMTDAEAEDWSPAGEDPVQYPPLVWALSTPEVLGAQAQTVLAECPFTASAAELRMNPDSY